MDDKVLSYYDSLIRRDDYDLLDGPKWLNDVIIEFGLAFFEKDKYKNYSDEFTYLGPSITQLIKVSDIDLAKSILDFMNIPEKKVLLIALNDETSITTSGGTHWSLLVYYPPTSTIEHYDSIQGEGNWKSALNFTEKLKAAGVSIKDGLKLGECVPQKDSYNCGIHLISNSEAILKRTFGEDSRSIKEIAHYELIHSMRQHMKDVIDNLAKQAEFEN